MYYEFSLGSSLKLISKIQFFLLQLKRNWFFNLKKLIYWNRLCCFPFFSYLSLSLSLSLPFFTLFLCIYLFLSFSLPSFTLFLPKFIFLTLYLIPLSWFSSKCVSKTSTYLKFIISSCVKKFDVKSLNI